MGHFVGWDKTSKVSDRGPRGAKCQAEWSLPAAKRPTIRFHTASSPFTVERDLRVKIAVKRKGNGTKVRPGDDIEVTITTTDPQGRPVAAELSLAMVEQSLLERFASPLPGIGDFFRGGERQPAVRCTSSITFSYRPATQPINPRLLAEKDREEVAREEEDSRRAAIAVASTTPGDGHGHYRRCQRRSSGLTITDGTLLISGFGTVPRRMCQPAGSCLASA